MHVMPCPLHMCLQPKSDGLQPKSDGLQPSSDGLHPSSNWMTCPLQKGYGLLMLFADPMECSLELCGKRV